MYKKKECIAMLLAGGQGSRLYALTEQTAKPAVQFGGKYRIIDFTMSNCVHSGLDTVGVLTQYQPLVLNEYIGTGEPWDLDHTSGGVHILPPYQGKKGADWYKGTANAIYQNLHFIERYDPTYVLILSGDHIYKMDYSRMLTQHKNTHADCTIATLEVPLSQAGRFGILTTDDTNRITAFEEKPEHPKSTRASMGIYIFRRDLLTEYLIRDENDANSMKDFGRNLIPSMLADGCSLYAYAFHGYWKDVGTVESLWRANMDLLGDKPAFCLYDPEWRIYSRNNAHPPQYIASGGHTVNSLITEGCEIYGTVENSVLGNGVRIGAGACVKNSVVMSNTVIEEGAYVHTAMIDSGVIIEPHAVIGSERCEEITVIGSGTRIAAHRKIDAGTMLSREQEGLRI